MIAFMAATVLSAVSSAFSASNAAEQARMSAELNSMQHKANAEIARMNAAKVRSELVSESKAFEMQGAIQGFRDGAAMADTRAKQGGSGVYMNSASSYQVRMSENLMHKANMANIDANRIYNQTAKMNEAVGYEANALMEEGMASAMSMVGQSISPGKNAAISGALSFGTSIASGYASGALGEAVSQAPVMESFGSSVGAFDWTVPSMTPISAPVSANPFTIIP